jgi:hypothetical protein
MNDMLSLLLKSILEGASAQNDMLKEEQLQQVASKMEPVARGGSRFSRKEAKIIIRQALAKQASSGCDSYEAIRDVLALFSPRERSNLFFDFVDPLLRDCDSYWKLFKFILSQSHASKRHSFQIRKSLSRYERMNSDGRERIQSSLIDPLNDAAEALSVYDSLEDEVVVYRGFIVSGTNRVRRSPDSTSPLYFQQNEGSGFSYTLNEDVALGFAAWAAYHYTDRLSKMRTKGKPHLTDFQKCLDQFFYRGGHPYVGRYLVSKQDIVLIITERGEMEVVVQPENVSLQSYRVLHSDDIYQKLIKACPIDFPMPEEMSWDPSEFQQIVRNWHKPSTM